MIGKEIERKGIGEINMIEIDVIKIETEKDLVQEIGPDKKGIKIKIEKGEKDHNLKILEIPKKEETWLINGILKIIDLEFYSMNNELFCIYNKAHIFNIDTDLRYGVSNA